MFSTHSHPLFGFTVIVDGKPIISSDDWTAQSKSFLWSSTGLALAGTVMYPWIRAWTVYLGHYEYARQAKASLVKPSSIAHYGGTTSVLLRGAMMPPLRGYGPWLAMVPITAFIGVCEARMQDDIQRYTSDGADSKLFTWLLGAASVGVAEMLCFPFRVAHVLMASELPGVPEPRPTARRILTDVFKYGLKSKPLRAAFWPSFFSSVFVSLDFVSPVVDIPCIFLAAMFNVISIRMMVASIPGAPLPYQGFGECTKTLLSKSPRTWFAGSLGLMFIAGSLDSMRSLYYRYGKSFAQKM